MVADMFIIYSHLTAENKSFEYESISRLSLAQLLDILALTPKQRKEV